MKVSKHKLLLSSPIPQTFSSTRFVPSSVLDSWNTLRKNTEENLIASHRVYHHSSVHVKDRLPDPSAPEEAVGTGSWGYVL